MPPRCNCIPPLMGIPRYRLAYYCCHKSYYKLSVSSLHSDSVIVEPPQTSFFIMAGGSICLKCELSTLYVSQQIEWRFNGGPIDYSHSRIQKFENSSLCITNAAISDTGSYVCDAGTDTLTYRLSITGTLTIVMLVCMYILCIQLTLLYHTGGIVVQSPTCSPQPLPPEAVSIGIGFGTTKYINLTTSFLEICCIGEGPVDQLMWLADKLPITDGQVGYEIGNNYLKVLGPFTEGCITYTCQAVYGSEIFQETSEVCSGCKYIIFDSN